MFRYTHVDREGNLLCDVSQYVKKHNVIYKTPPKKPQDGLPLGNGAMGGMVYHSDRELCMRINRTDSFDYGPAENFGAWGHEWEEKCTTLANCGLLKFSDGTPAFAWEYLDDYDMTLDLGQGEIRMESKTPFSSWRATGYGSLEDSCMVWEVEAFSEEPLERTVTLERYGTRGFFHYYESFTRDTRRRLYGVTPTAGTDMMLLTQELHGCTFTTAVTVVHPEVRYEVTNQREVRCILPAAQSVKFRVLVTTALSTDGEDTEAMATDTLLAAREEGDAIHQRHLAWWREFWNRSFIQIGDELVENLYYIHRYQFGCSGYGAFPPSVFGSLWTTFGDTRNWGHYYHWNDQMQFWAPDTWNHGEMLKPYFDYRLRMLPKAIADGRTVHGVDGAWYSDISSADGFQAVEPDTRGNMSCGAMIALQMYRHYKHFPDSDFLRDVAWPVMKACGDLYLGLLVKEEDGKYHIHDVTAMEGYLYLNDTMSDWAMIQALFEALLEVAEEVNAPKELVFAWKDRLENLYDPPTMTVEGKSVFAYGRFEDGRICTDTKYPEGDMATGIMGTLMCVFPALLYHKNSVHRPWFELVKNTAELAKDREAGCGWDLNLPVNARMGYREELERGIHAFARTYMIYPSGLTNFNPPDTTGRYTARAIPEGVTHTQWGDLHEKDKGERVRYDAERFSHFYSEPMAVVTAAVHESLIQSSDGVIRVFPTAGDGLFRLHAEGDFMVTAQKTGEQVRFVAIESRRGGRVTLISPFKGDEAVRCGRDYVEFEKTADNGEIRISFETSPGKTYLVFSRDDHIDGSYPTQVPVSENREPKRFGDHVIGLERDF